MGSAGSGRGGFSEEVLPEGGRKHPSVERPASIALMVFSRNRTSQEVPMAHSFRRSGGRHREGGPGEEGRAGDRDLVLEVSTHSIFIQDLQKLPSLV